jgi:hypothetical protein
MRCPNIWLPGRNRRIEEIKVTISLTGCATGISEPRTVTVCPPVVEYDRGFQAPSANELDLLPERLAIAERLSDYAVMRDQASMCI